MIVAFHFEFSNQAGWKCDICRKSGLEARRRCGWIPTERRGPSRIVWARKTVALETCPQSFITAESQSFVKEYFVRRKLGAFPVEQLSAREVDAFVTLEREFQAETSGSRNNDSRPA